MIGKLRILVLSHRLNIRILRAVHGIIPLIMVSMIPHKRSSSKIYHIHIQKTGGTSINDLMIDYFSSGSITYKDLMKSKGKFFIYNNTRIVGYSKVAVNLGIYDYAFGHAPSHSLCLKKGVYTFTVLREPRARIYSRYKHLKNDIERKDLNSFNVKEYDYIGYGFREYLMNLTPKEIALQLHMFSKNIDVIEGLDGISKVSKVMFTDTLEEEWTEMSSELDIKGKMRHMRKLVALESQSQIEKIFNDVAQSKPDFENYFIKELEFYTNVRSIYGKSNNS